VAHYKLSFKTKEVLVYQKKLNILLSLVAGQAVWVGMLEAQAVVLAVFLLLPTLHLILQQITQ
jgi:hypothetical protein